MKKEVRLYNVLFPVWLLWLFPQIFLIVAPANLLVDCLVLTLALMGLKHQNKRTVVKELWWKFWLRGFAADFIGVLVLLPGLFLPVIFPNVPGIEGMDAAMIANPFLHPVAFLWVLAGVAVAGVCIYRFDKRAMKECELLTQREKHVVALTMAIVTAPWLFFIPLYWY